MKKILAKIKKIVSSPVKRVKLNLNTFTLPKQTGIIRHKGKLYVNGKLLPEKDQVLLDLQIAELLENEVFSLILVSVKHETSMHILNSVNDTESLNLNRAILHTVDLIEEKLSGLRLK
jgi:hypothetical protein